MAPQFITIGVKGDATRKVRRKVGDQVRLLKPPASMHVVPLPAPRIVSLRKVGTKVQATVQVQVEKMGPTGAPVQSLETVDVFGPELETPEEVLDIGDHVIVATKLPNVVVPLETTGIILGGNGELYHVAFTMRKNEAGDVIEPPIHVNQDRVSIHALKLVKKGNRELSAGSSEEEDDDEEDEEAEEEEEEEDDNEEDEEKDDDDEHEKTDEEDEKKIQFAASTMEGGAMPKTTSSLTSSLLYLRSSLSADVYTAAFQQLSVNELPKFADFIKSKSNQSVKDADSLQGVIELFRKTVSVIPYPMPPSYFAALRAAGASAADLTRMQQDPSLAGQPLREFIRRVARFY